MKTIESILKHAEQIGKEPGKPQDQRMINNIKIGMRVAIDTVQRWIPVGEELPIQEQLDYQIICKIKESSYCPWQIITIPFKGTDFDFVRFSILYSHWRLIELK